MSTPMNSTAIAGQSPRSTSTSVEAKRMLRSAIQRLAAWREASRRAAQERDALANMSARQLRDIGIAQWGTNDVIRETPWIGDLHR